MANSTTEESTGDDAQAAGLPCTLNTIPTEILNIVGGYLDPLDLSALIRTAKRVNVTLTPILLRKALRGVTIGLEGQKTILDWAIFEGHLEMAKTLLHLLNMGKGLLKRKIYQSALEFSAQKGHLDICQIILKDSAHVLNLSKHGTEALNNAIVSHFPEIYTLLVDAGARAKAPDISFSFCESSLGIRAIHAAAYWGRIDLLQFLTRYCASLNEPEYSSLWRPLHYAAFHGQDLTVEYLLNNGADPTKQNKDRQTALMNIATNMEPPNWPYKEFKKRTIGFSTSYKRIIRLFLDYGLELSQIDYNGHTILHLASANGYTELVEYLISLGANPTSGDARGLTPLHHAIFNHHATTSEVLISAGASLMATDHTGASSIHTAAAVGYPSMAFLKLLAVKGVDPLALDENGWTPLHHAAEGGFFDTLKLLLEVTDAKFILPSKKPLTLRGAVKNHDVDMAQYLLEAGVEIDPVERGIFPKLPPLYIAIMEGCEDLVELLLSRGADPNQKHRGSNPLNYAISKGAMRIVRILLRKGADISGEDVDILAEEVDTSEAEVVSAGEEEFLTPPLIVAVENCHLDLVMLLLDEGADINIRSRKNYGVLETAAWHDCDFYLQCECECEAMVRLLLDKGVDVSAYSRHRGSSLSIFCAQGGRHSTIKAMVEAGANVKSQDSFGNTLLHDVARRCFEYKPFCSDIFQYLVEKGADPLLVNKSLLTPLHIACAGDLDFDLQSLLATGIDITSQDTRGWTALHYAAYVGHFLQLSQLINALKQREFTSSDIQAILNLRDVNGWTAMHLAVAKSPLNFRGYMQGVGSSYRGWAGLTPKPQESSEVVWLLLESGADPSIINEAGQTPLDFAELQKPKDEFDEERELNRTESLMLLEKAGAQRGLGLAEEVPNPQPESDYWARPTPRLRAGSWEYNTPIWGISISDSGRLELEPDSFAISEW
ncbi:hypothetical protein MferCBS31731_005842 [Microsporum ferrugineum]